jgi:hypothetical protein
MNQIDRFKRRMPLQLFSLALIALAHGSAVSADDGDCEPSPPPSSPVKCGADEYDAIFRKEDGMGCPKCMASVDPPAPVTILCSWSAGSESYWCDVSPIGSNLHYSWQASGMIHTSQPAWWSGSTQEIWCGGVPGGINGGALTVTVTSPFGVSAQGDIHLACDGMSEL